MLFQLKPLLYFNIANSEMQHLHTFTFGLLRKSKLSLKLESDRLSRHGNVLSGLLLLRGELSSLTETGSVVRTGA